MYGMLRSTHRRHARRETRAERGGARGGEPSRAEPEGGQSAAHSVESLSARRCEVVTLRCNTRRETGPDRQRETKVPVEYGKINPTRPNARAPATCTSAAVHVASPVPRAVRGCACRLQWPGRARGSARSVRPSHPIACVRFSDDAMVRDSTARARAGPEGLDHTSHVSEWKRGGEPSRREPWTQRAERRLRVVDVACDQGILSFPLTYQYAEYGLCKCCSWR